MCDLFSFLFFLLVTIYHTEYKPFSLLASCLLRSLLVHTSCLLSSWPRTCPGDGSRKFFVGFSSPIFIHIYLSKKNFPPFTFSWVNKLSHLHLLMEEFHVGNQRSPYRDSIAISSPAAPVSCLVPNEGIETWLPGFRTTNR
jgi:hypothetical protein